MAATVDERSHAQGTMTDITYKSKLIARCCVNIIIHFDGSRFRQIYCFFCNTVCTDRSLLRAVFGKYLYECGSVSDHVKSFEIAYVQVFDFIIYVYIKQHLYFAKSVIGYKIHIERRPYGGTRMFRKASKQINWPREPLPRIIVKRTKLHVKQQRRKQKGT